VDVDIFGVAPWANTPGDEGLRGKQGLGQLIRVLGQSELNVHAGSKTKSWGFFYRFSKFFLSVVHRAINMH